MFLIKANSSDKVTRDNSNYFSLLDRRRRSEIKTILSNVFTNAAEKLVACVD